jgi:dihydropteroate synthase
MGVLNVTPDSFSDGGKWLDPGAAVAHGLAMAGEGADLVDVGGESTRPGATSVSTEEELRRVLPVVETLAGRGVLVSVDTMRAAVAERALAAGAVIVNDVTGGRADERMATVVARAGAPFVAMHWRMSGPAQRPGHDDGAHYDDVAGEVAAELEQRLSALADAGLDPERVVLDPGLGFSKNAQHNWALLRGLGRIVAIGRPVLVGASRKRFLGSLLAGPDGSPVPVERRDAATAAVTTAAALVGAWCVRVHAVGPRRSASRRPSTQPSTQPSTRPPARPPTRPPTRPSTRPPARPPTRPDPPPPPPDLRADGGRRLRPARNSAGAGGAGDGRSARMPV